MTNSKSEFISKLQKHRINTKYLVVKPNWISNEPGEYTEAEILDWLFEAYPNTKKIVVESYTPWKGLKFIEPDTHKGKGVTLKGGKKHWDFYKKQDSHFLHETGNDEVLKRHNANYINITNEVWSDKCVEPNVIKSLVESNGESVKWKELYSYIPKKLFDIRNDSTLVSLSKIKIEESIPIIYISMSIKNLFGLIPHPSRWIPFHGEDHSPVPQVIKDIYTIYTSLFEKNLWIAEGIKTLIRNYFEPDQEIVKNKNIMFIGKNAVEVDSLACKSQGLKPDKVPHIQLLKQSK